MCNKDDASEEMVKIDLGANEDERLRNSKVRVSLNGGIRG